MKPILYLDPSVKHASKIKLGLYKLIKESLVYSDIDSFIADAFNGESETADKYYINTYDNYRSSLDLVNRLRNCMVRCYICFDNPVQVRLAFSSIKPKKLYEYIERNISASDQFYEVTSKADWRFSPFFMKYGDSNIEDYYQLWIKGYGYLGYDCWKEVKGKVPLEWIPVDHAWTREEVYNDNHYLYLFTDNLNRTSGRTQYDDYGNILNAVDEKSPYYIHYGNDKILQFPRSSQAVIRGLENAYPITTMKDQYRHQLDNLDLMMDVWDKEIYNIRVALNTGYYKGIKFASSIFGKGKYSNIVGPMKSLLDSKLARIGIDNTGDTTKPLIKMTLDMVYQDYFTKYPELLFELANIGLNKKFYDRFYTSTNSQAAVYCRLLNQLFKLV